MSQNQLKRISEKSGPLKVIAGTPDRPLVIGDIEISCYVLEDETRVLSQRGMIAGLGMSRGGTGAGDRLAHFVGQNALQPFVSGGLVPVIADPIVFKNPVGGGVVYGYPATALADICDAVLDARKAGALQRQQEHIAEQCETLVRAFARIGIIALVDEATGYQEVRDRNDLNQYLDLYLKEERAEWAKRFPTKFYRQIFRLHGWEWKGMHVNRPQVVGHYTNDLVWDRIAPHVREELDRRNPKNEMGYRQARHHQWLTEDVGHPALQQHIGGVCALMIDSSSWESFKGKLDNVYPKLEDMEIENVA